MPRYQDTRDRRVYDAMRSMRARLPHIHLIHFVLAAGVGALWLAFNLPWGTDASGAPIYIQQFSIPRLADQSVDFGQLAIQTATFIASAAVILGATLLALHVVYIGLKRVLNHVRLAFLATILFVPLFALLLLLLIGDLLLAAGFGGLSALTQLPVIRDSGVVSMEVAHAAVGFYLWWLGIIITLVGAIGEIFVDRR
jgi:hypothetical protein